MEKAGDDIKGAVLASDAFFPFSWGDSVEMACQVRYITVITLLHSRWQSGSVCCWLPLNRHLSFQPIADDARAHCKAAHE
jgi:hypothetical protein